MSYDNTLTTEDAFQRYEEIRERLPKAEFPDASQQCAGLIEAADHVDAFILDSFGVLNVGDTPIEGATACMAELRKRGKQLVVLTNAASTPRQDALAKYHRLGFDFTADEVVSSRDVCAARLASISAGARWGAIAAEGDGFGDIAADLTPWTGVNAPDVDGFVLLSSANLDGETFERLERALAEAPRPVVVANPDLVAPREQGLSKEPGFYAQLLADRLDCAPIYFGKPFPDAFEDARARLGNLPPERIAMVGDTLHTDILGGRAAGLRTVLITDHGLFAGRPVAGYIKRSGIVPDFITATV